MTLAELIEKGLQLSPADQAGVDAAWKVEFRRHIADVESGSVQLVDHAETVRQARVRVDERRAKRTS